jgi:glutamate transport system substrate-binding protein
MTRILIALALLLTGCGVAGAGSSSIVDKDSLVIGVKPDQPGLGLRGSDGTYRGFDVDVASYIARKLGATKFTFRPTPSSVRDKALQDETVDMIVATYSITQERKTKITFAGPYYVAHQDTAIRAGDPVKNVRDLKGRRLCQVTGSNSWKRVVEEKKIAADLAPSASYSECFTKLTAKAVDAVSTDDLILAGFVQRAQGSPVKLVNAPFTDEKYGVGLHKGDLDGCETVNRIITEMYQDGTAKALLGKWFGRSGLRLTTAVPQFEGCA